MKYFAFFLSICFSVVFFVGSDCGGGNCPEGQVLRDGKCINIGPTKAEKCRAKEGAVWADLGAEGSKCLEGEAACLFQAGNWYEYAAPRVDGWCLYSPQVLLCENLDADKCASVAKCSMTTDGEPKCEKITEKVLCANEGEVWSEQIKQCVSLRYGECLENNQYLAWVQGQCMFDCSKIEDAANCSIATVLNSEGFGYCSWDASSKTCSVSCSGLSSSRVDGADNQQFCSAAGCAWVAESNSCMTQAAGCEAGDGTWVPGEGCVYNQTPECSLELIASKCASDVACEWTGTRCTNTLRESCEAPNIWYNDACMTVAKYECLYKNEAGKKPDIWYESDNVDGGTCYESPENFCNGQANGRWESNVDGTKFTCVPKNYPTCYEYSFSQQDPGYNWQTACASRKQLGCSWMSYDSGITGSGFCYDESFCKASGYLWLLDQCVKPPRVPAGKSITKVVGIPACAFNVERVLLPIWNKASGEALNQPVSEIELCHTETGLNFSIRNVEEALPSDQMNLYTDCNDLRMRSQSGFGMMVVPVANAADLQEDVSNFVELLWGGPAGIFGIKNGTFTPPKFTNPPLIGSWIPCAQMGPFLSSGDGKSGWQVQGNINFSEIGAKGGSGQVLKANFYRKIMQKAGSEACTPETCDYLMWRPTFSDPPNFYEPEYFGVFVLE